VNEIWTFFSISQRLQGLHLSPCKKLLLVTQAEAAFEELWNF
jgi:hypothetical protein